MSRKFWGNLMLSTLLVVGLFLAPTGVVRAATQTISGTEAEGNLRISVQDGGAMRVEQYNGTAWQDNMYGTWAKGTTLFVGPTTRYDMGGISTWTPGSAPGVTATALTAISNNTAGLTITTVWEVAGTVRVTQTTSYTDGDQHYDLTWDVQNLSGTALTDLRLFHGQDTLLAGSDSGNGWWDAGTNSIGVTHPTTGQQMWLKGITTPFNHESRLYSTSRDHVDAGALDGTVTMAVHDNGYALEWRNGSLAAGATWAVQAEEHFTLTGSVDTTTTALTSSPNPSQYGQQIAFTATVTSTYGSGTPTGSVTFKDGGVDIAGCVGLSLSGSAQAVCYPAACSLNTGTYSITAEYSGDATYNTSTSSLLSQVVGKADTTTAIVSSRNPSLLGQTLTFTATVSPVAPGGCTPTGSVTFYDDDHWMADMRTLSGGQAEYWTMYPFAVGTHRVSASYPGSTNFNGSTSPDLLQRVDQATDLAIEKSVELVHYSEITFTIVVRNKGCCCVPVEGAVVSDTLHSNVISATWTCTSSGGASCGAASGSGNIYEVLPSFPPGGVVTYTVRGSLNSLGYFKNTAEVIVSSGLADIIPGNNSATVERWFLILPLVFRNGP